MIILLTLTSMFLLLYILFVLMLIDHLWVCYPCCYSFWLSYSRLACVQTWMISLRPTWPFVAWLLFSFVFTCCLSMRVAYLSPYLQPSGFGHFLHFSSYFYNCEALCVFVSLAELMVESRAISMFGSILEEADTLMLIGVRSLKTYIA